MLLVIDIGNTNTVLGVYDGRRLVKDWRLRTERNTTEDEVNELPVCYDILQALELRITRTEFALSGTEGPGYRVGRGRLERGGRLLPGLALAGVGALLLVAAQLLLEHRHRLVANHREPPFTLRPLSTTSVWPLTAAAQGLAMVTNSHATSRGWSSRPRLAASMPISRTRSASG